MATYWPLMQLAAATEGWQDVGLTVRVEVNLPSEGDTETARRHPRQYQDLMS
jgi:hypothetical protein